MNICRLAARQVEDVHEGQSPIATGSLEALPIGRYLLVIEASHL
jgi:hypothetical protein